MQGQWTVHMHLLLQVYLPWADTVHPTSVNRPVDSLTVKHSLMYVCVCVYVLVCVCVNMGQQFVSGCSIQASSVIICSFVLPTVGMPTCLIGLALSSGLSTVPVRMCSSERLTQYHNNVIMLIFPCWKCYGLCQLISRFLYAQLECFPQCAYSLADLSTHTAMACHSTVRLLACHCTAWWWSSVNLPYHWYTLQGCFINLDKNMVCVCGDSAVGLECKHDTCWLLSRWPLPPALLLSPSWTVCYWTRTSQSRGQGPTHHP